jgi:ammonium transporter, Amt family
MKPAFSAVGALSAAFLTGAALLVATPAFAAGPTVEKGDTAFMMIATVLVLLMTIPGLALFYGGLVRTKNMLSMLTQVMFVTVMVMMVWVFYGYSLAFTNGGSMNWLIGGMSKAGLSGVTPSSMAATFSNGVYIPEYVYICFQMTFACITPALIVGATAERVRFPAVVLFCLLWVTLIYLPMAHMVWYWGGPDAWAKAAADLAAATDKTAGQAAYDAALQDAGMLFQWGALDFAGGTVVHINAGIAGLVGAIVAGKRVGYGKEAMPPHSLTMTMIGAALLWVGWFGFNVGSNLEANGTAALAMINTFVATAAAGMSWMLIEWITKGKPSLLGLASGVVAGLVAVTPACGFAGPMGAIVLGLVAGVVCFFFCSTVKHMFNYDDSLDIFGVHCIGGILGAIATGILVNPDFGGTGVGDYTTKPGELLVAAYSSAQVMIQVKTVLVTLLLSGGGSLVLWWLISVTIGLRPSVEGEREGLDVIDHGERAYNY